MNLATGEAAELGLLPETLRDLTWDPDRQVLWGLSTKGNGLVELDPANGSLRRRVKLAYEKSADAPDAVLPDVALKTLVYDPFDKVLLGTATSLVRVDPQTGTVSATRVSCRASGQE